MAVASRAGPGWPGVKPPKPEGPVTFKFPVSGHVCFPSLTDPTDTLAKSAETTGSYEITPKEPCA